MIHESPADDTHTTIKRSLKAAAVSGVLLTAGFAANPAQARMVGHSPHRMVGHTPARMVGSAPRRMVGRMVG